jgi:beta-mannosidase
MHQVDLGGKWSVRKAGTIETYAAQVPGNIHHDLLRAKKLADPYQRDNESAAQWVGAADWIYSREITVPPFILKQDRVLLRCEGLDTLATLTLNGKPVGETDNMFRIWEFDVKNLLRKGSNRLEVRFASAVKFAAARASERPKNQPLPQWAQPGAVSGGMVLRKEPCNFGWDWGPCLVTCGIWRPIQLIAFNTARFSDLHISQDHSRKDRVTLTLQAATETTGQPAPLRVKVAVVFQNKKPLTREVVLKRGKAVAELEIQNPQLWWPNGMGPHPLYDVTLELLTADGERLDATTRRIGLRTLKLDRHPDKWGESFQFVVNGVPFFAKGANWIPGDAILARMTRADYERLISDAATANMNMLRAWGGGIYEDNAFFDICDRLGICVWQDFMFSCSTYPTFDTRFMASVQAEVEDNIRRLRHHPSLALWCGNNELEQGLVSEKWYHAQTWKKWTMSWRDYARLFDRLLPETIRRLDPERDYWPGSPHTPPPYDRNDFNSAKAGDAHLWEVWHGRKPFEWYRTCEHRFNSEFGFQSFPEPRTVRGYTAAGDRNVTSAIMEHHQRSSIGNTAIMQYMSDWFLLPRDFVSTLWLSQILQGMAMKYAVEHWRRSMPRGMGTLYWQLNDCWPVASWSSIDYHGRWKALHYMARHFFAPALVSGVMDAERGTVQVHVTSDNPDAQPGRLTWILTDAQGKPIKRGRLQTTVPVRKSINVASLSFRQELKRHGVRHLLLWLELSIKGRIVSTDLVIFSRPKHLALNQPDIQACVKTGKNGTFRVTLKTNHAALWTWLELDATGARWSDNFVHLRPGRVVSIDSTPTRPLTLAAFRRQLVVRSLWDTSDT